MAMSPTYDQTFWEALWQKTLREHADKVAQRKPNAHLTAEFAGLAPGRALDAGCGHGVEALWLAAHGWDVTAVDFSLSALAQGRSMAQALGDDLAARIRWLQADLTTWSVPVAASYDLVLCLYVHVAGPMQAFVRKMAEAVAVGGTLFMVGHRPLDPETGLATAAAGQSQIAVSDVVSELEAPCWEIQVAEERPRLLLGSGVDALVRAKRLR